MIARALTAAGGMCSGCDVDAYELERAADRERQQPHRGRRQPHARRAAEPEAPRDEQDAAREVDRVEHEHEELQNLLGQRAAA